MSVVWLSWIRVADQNREAIDDALFDQRDELMARIWQSALLQSPVWREGIIPLLLIHDSLDLTMTRRSRLSSCHNSAAACCPAQGCNVKNQF
jgi:hypothetical protein